MLKTEDLEMKTKIKKEEGGRTKIYEGGRMKEDEGEEDEDRGRRSTRRRLRRRKKKEKKEEEGEEGGTYSMLETNARKKHTQKTNATKKHMLRIKEEEDGEGDHRETIRKKKIKEEDRKLKTIITS